MTTPAVSVQLEPHDTLGKKAKALGREGIVRPLVSTVAVSNPAPCSARKDLLQEPEPEVERGPVATRKSIRGWQIGEQVERQLERFRLRG